MASWIIYSVSAALTLLVMLGIAMMSKPKTAMTGNLLSALAILAGIVFTLLEKNILSVWTLYPSIIVGTFIGGLMAARVKMIQMPQMVALFNGVGGGTSALVGFLSVAGIGVLKTDIHAQFGIFFTLTGYLAIAVGMITLVGSLVAAGKLHRVIGQKPQVWAFHSMVTMLSLLIVLVFTIVGSLPGQLLASSYWLMWGVILFSGVFGLFFSIRVGGADMPITISLLNSLSGVAGAIAGMAIGDVLLVAVGGIVGASGLLLTQIMCRAMNRSLLSILFARVPKKKNIPVGGAAKVEQSGAKPAGSESPQAAKVESAKELEERPAAKLAKAKRVIIVPGYGMALAQAQHQVKHLADALTARGIVVRYAIHPVAGRMPGHMNVLLAEVNVPYDELFQMEDINDDFAKCDVTIVIGANDVLNPAARDAEGTPIYGMPVLNVDEAPYTIICNYDLKAGYAGVDNPLYGRKEGVALMLGDAKSSLQKLSTDLLDEWKPKSAMENLESEAPKAVATGLDYEKALHDAKRVIIVPGYGMALAQAQHQVKQLADMLSSRGAEVRYAIHPVAGRMPGHMNVLLAEENVPYDELFQMDDINDDFAKCDVTIVIGANDVLNPAARDAEDTPIYGMPVLNVDESPAIIICNYDLKPGYAGVENPLYNRKVGVALLLGDAKESLEKLKEALSRAF